MSKKSTGRTVQNNPSNTKDMATLNARAEEGRKKAAQRKSAAAGHGTPKAPQRTMGRTANERVFYKFDFGARFITERPIPTETGDILVPAGKLIEIVELIGERGRKIVVAGEDLPHYIVTTSQLYKGVAA